MISVKFYPSKYYNNSNFLNSFNVTVKLPKYYSCTWIHYKVQNKFPLKIGREKKQYEQGI